MLGATTLRMYVFVIATGLLTALALLLSPPATVSYDVGTLADRTVKAPRSVAFVSETLTEAERERAAAAVAKVYTRDPAVVASSRDRLAQAVAAIGRVRADVAQTRDQRITSISRLTEVAISPQLAPLVVSALIFPGQRARNGMRCPPSSSVPFFPFSAPFGR